MTEIQSLLKILDTVEWSPVMTHGVSENDLLNYQYISAMKRNLGCKKTEKNLSSFQSTQMLWKM